MKCEPSSSGHREAHPSRGLSDRVSHCFAHGGDEADFKTTLTDILAPPTELGQAPDDWDVTESRRV